MSRSRRALDRARLIVDRLVVKGTDTRIGTVLDDRALLELVCAGADDGRAQFALALADAVARRAVRVTSEQAKGLLWVLDELTRVELTLQ